MAGLNTTVEYRGSLYHIQTQDSGLGSNYVETIIYKSGKVISSRRTSYTSYLNNPALHENIEKIIQEQHEAMIQEMNEGKFDHL